MPLKKLNFGSQSNDTFRAQNSNHAPISRTNSTSSASSSNSSGLLSGLSRKRTSSTKATSFDSPDGSRPLKAPLFHEEDASLLQAELLSLRARLPKKESLSLERNKELQRIYKSLKTSSEKVSTTSREKKSIEKSLKQLENLGVTDETAISKVCIVQDKRAINISSKDRLPQNLDTEGFAVEHEGSGKRLSAITEHSQNNEHMAPSSRPSSNGGASSLYSDEQSHLNVDGDNHRHSQASSLQGRGGRRPTSYSSVRSNPWRDVNETARDPLMLQATKLEDAIGRLTKRKADLQLELDRLDKEYEKEYKKLEKTLEERKMRPDQARNSFERLQGLIKYSNVVLNGKKELVDAISGVERLKVQVLAESPQRQGLKEQVVHLNYQSEHHKNPFVQSGLDRNNLLDASKRQEQGVQQNQPSVEPKRKKLSLSRGLKKLDRMVDRIKQKI